MTTKCHAKFARFGSPATIFIDQKFEDCETGILDQIAQSDAEGIHAVLIGCLPGSTYDALFQSMIRDAVDEGELDHAIQEARDAARALQDAKEE